METVGERINTEIPDANLHRHAGSESRSICLSPTARPEWRVRGFRDNLKPSGESGIGRQGQQQVLRAYFLGIHDSVRKLLSARIGTLNYRYRNTHDQGVKTELDRLTAELEKLPERWEYRGGI